MRSQRKQPISDKQKAFCKAYALNGGNAARAASDAGYTHPVTQGSRLLTSSKVKEYLSALGPIETREDIAEVDEMRAFWTKVARDEGQAMVLRLKASEHLVKSRGGFLDRVESKDVTERPLSVTVVSIAPRVVVDG